MRIRWDKTKNLELKETRGVSFRELIHWRLIDIVEHHAKQHQDLLLFEHNEYVWEVPFVTEDDGIFLKTAYPSRKYTRIYGKKKI